jgi:acylphosphatase
MIRQRFIFQGRVQRVGFRARALHIAASHRITGWVRNEPDGTVMLEVQGSEPILQAYLDDLRRRTSGLVEREISATIEPEINEQEFTIER